MPKKALFVIDTQAELVSISSTAMPYGARICEVGTKILNRARTQPAKELDIIMVQHSDDPEDPNATLLRGNEAWELALPPREDAENERVVHKTTGDTFESNPTLANDLKARGVTTIVAFGVQSECCVRATSRGAISAGFEVVLLQGAHSTYHNQETGKSAEEIESEIEEELQAIGVQVIPWDKYEF
ncbi:uncharacterized protein N7483_004144 [Penicillium malachiteum]|uniref:uncharacterized protein n=1 Tax=Penicillium malachiteum TaxID=1324776 RepID=UPI0025469506|nr:uncharacterized protein N7483_004144 [Penicillium malachiteum]KAJ5729636.1 hypothetical protein N7483_004144 [Penicillium malachiteum]